MTTSRKHFILTADDLGMDESFDRAVFKGFTNGILTCACITPNGESFDYAVSLLPQCKGLELGVHLNIIEGKSLLQHELLTDEDGYFHLGFLGIMSKCLSGKFLKEVEAEFRAQIEKVIKIAPVSFLNSHVHTHAIGPIFELTARLAKEYGISAVRLQAEKFYSAKRPLKPLNIVKVMLLNYLSSANRQSARRLGVKTNDFIAGVGYTGEMDSDTVFYAAKSLSKLKDIALEVLVHPSDDTCNPRFREFELLMNPKLKENIQALGFEFCGFKNL